MDTPEDQGKAQEVYLAVTQMGVQLFMFEHCVSLFEFLTEHAQEKAEFDDAELIKRAWWRFIPAQQGALAIWNFRKSIDALRTAVRKHPSISSAVDTAGIKRSTEVTFRSKFPDWDKLRYGVAHNAEAHLSAPAGQKHSAAGPNVLGLELGANERLQASGIIGGRLLMTIDGQEVSYAVNRQSVEALRLVSNQAIDALEKRIPDKQP